MFKKITLALAFCSLVGVGALPVLTGTAHAASTEERFQQSKIIMMTTRNGVPFYAEPGKDSLTLGFYPKGTISCPSTRPGMRWKTKSTIYASALTVPLDGSRRTTWL